MHIDRRAGSVSPFILGATAILAVALLPDVVRAQGTGRGLQGCSVARSFECVLLYRRDGREREERQWPTAIVLWRVPPESLLFAAASRAQHEATDLRYRQLQRAAEDSGWKFMGGRSGPVIRELATDSTDSRIRIRERTFTVPERDSALVVLVDLTRDSSYTPVIVAHTYVPAVLPEGYWTRSWTSGDTTFVVRPRNTEVILTRHLRSNPVIAAFLDKP